MREDCVIEQYSNALVLHDQIRTIFKLQPDKYDHFLHLLYISFDINSYILLPYEGSFCCFVIWQFLISCKG